MLVGVGVGRWAGGRTNAGEDNAAPFPIAEVGTVLYFLHTESDVLIKGGI